MYKQIHHGCIKKFVDAVDSSSRELMCHAFNCTVLGLLL